MGKFYECSYNFKYSWDQIAQGLWKRYPNPQSNHVLSEDVISRHIGPDNKLHSKRILTKTNILPKWGERFVNNKFAVLIEESIIDPVNKVITTYTRNVTLRNLMQVEEKCVYTADAENPSQTVLCRKACISSSIFGLSRAVQAFGVERYKKNSVKAVKGFEYVLENVFKPAIQDGTSKSLPLINREKLKETATKAKELAESSSRWRIFTA